MRCSKGMVKKRHSKGGGHPGNYHHSLRGHAWIVNGAFRRCKACSLSIPRLSDQKTIRIKHDEYGYVIRQNKVNL